MNIQIEDYFGNGVLKIEYCLKLKIISQAAIDAVSKLAYEHGYGIADIDCDDNGIDFIRVQQVNVDNTEEQEKESLVSLVNNLNKEFL